MAKGKLMLMVQPLTAKQAEMIDVLRSMGAGWHSRIAIATAMGKNRLNVAEVAALDELSARGELERRLAIGSRNNANQWQYRLRGENEGTDEP